MKNSFFLLLLLANSLKAQYKSFSHPNTVYDVAVSENGDLVATAGKDSVVRVFSTNGKFIKQYEGFSHAVSDVVFNHSGSEILAADYAGNRYVLDIESNEMESAELHKSAILDVYILEDAEVFVTTSRDKSAKIWESNWKRRADLVGHEGQVRKAMYIESHGVFTVADDGAIKIWTLDGTLKRSIDSAHESGIWEMVKNENGGITTGDKNGNIKVWNRELGEVLTWKAHDDAISGMVQFGNFLVTAGLDGNLKIWDKKGVLLKKINGHEMYSSGLSISSDHLLLASSGGDGMVHLWKIEELIGEL